jgi:hypothetical protein
MSANPLLIPALAVALLAPSHGQTVHVTRFWHVHQPIYWPEWNSGVGQDSRVQYAHDSMRLKSSNTYYGSTNHPQNDLEQIFGLPDRIAAYQGRPRNALASIGNSGGFAMSYSGSLIDNVRNLASNNWGYGSGWNAGNTEARGWTTPAGSRRMDMVGFTYHHSLGPLLPKAVFRKELQIFKQAWWKAWGGNPNLTDHSKGFFPTEMAYSRDLVDVLVDEGYEWLIVASHHISRTSPSYNDRVTPSSFGIYSNPPNRADQLGPRFDNPAQWWFEQPNPGQAAWNVSPYAYQLHRVKYVNPNTGAEKSMLAVPSDDVISYQAGYSGAQIGLVNTKIAPHANDSNRPALVMPSTDGDNAWGGGYDSWEVSTPAFFGAAQSNGYGITTPQDFVNQYGQHAPTAHIEEGAWIYPESCYGSPQFLKWIEPPLRTSTASPTTYPDTIADIPNGWSLKFFAYAPKMAGANWVETAEQIWRDNGGTVEAWKIQAPYDWDGTWTNPNVVELAWHIYLKGLDSGFQYYGGLGNDDEVKPGLATRRAIETLQSYMAANIQDDRTGPTILKPQRFPYNPGGYTFGWFNRIPEADTNYLKRMASDFHIWTLIHDVSDVAQVNLKIRRDKDGIRSLSNNHNLTYAGGSDVEGWFTLPMTRRVLPNTRAELNALANHGQIDFVVTAPEIADQYHIKIDDALLPGFRDNLFDYYIEAIDERGNITRSEIQHVYVEDDQGDGGNWQGPPSGGPLPFEMDGDADFPSYLISNPGMTIHAALRGDILYLATWSPGSEFGNDHFIVVSDEALATATTPAPWAKAGTLAVPPGSPFLGAESSSGYIGWFNTGSATIASARAPGKQMEGTLNLREAFGTLPETLYLAALAYQTADAGLLGSQAPAMISDNGNVDPNELLAIPLEVLRDHNADGVFDRLDPARGFTVTRTSRVEGGFEIEWNAFPGRSYAIEASATLAPDSWDTLDTITIPQGVASGAFYHAVDPDVEPTRFFRVRLVE